MTRPAAEYDAALKLITQGINDCEISRRLGIPRSTVRGWRRPTYVPLGHLLPQRRGVASGQHAFDCPRCDGSSLDEASYAHLLGLYLGDGHIVLMPNRRSFRLSIVLDQRYPEIIDECYGSMLKMRPPRHMRANFGHQLGCVTVFAYWKHWPCIFPQHGPGMKHRRSVALQLWQQSIADAHPKQLLRGLIQSDGWRGTNFANARGKRYEYPRYQFTNESTDIHQMFRRACSNLNIEWTSAPRQTYVSKRAHVAYMDSFIGLKM